MKETPVTSATRLDQKHEEKLKECRETTIEKLVISLCIEAKYLTKQDVQERSRRYQWVRKITEYCVDATLLEDVVEGEPVVPLTYSDCDKVMAEKQSKAKAIVTIVAKEIVRGLPLYQG
ncbi:hypothetical protein AB6D66_22330 [Vibrio pomeroyi]|uniref:Uncharacterized protein n=1 Tax=Vibrio pomeroyi TaxID=198832 RepID=A0ABV4N2T2_9VIBR